MEEQVLSELSQENEKEECAAKLSGDSEERTRWEGSLRRWRLMVGSWRRVIGSVREKLELRCEAQRKGRVRGVRATGIREEAVEDWKGVRWNT